MKGEKHKQTPSIGSKSAVAIVPPKKVRLRPAPPHPNRPLALDNDCRIAQPSTRRDAVTRATGGWAPRDTAADAHPPRQVIRATDDYIPDESLIQTFAKAGVQVLSFSKGDFFHVIGREDDPHWYEACNPALPDARGLVPVTYFQVLGRTERDSADGSRHPPMAKNPDHDSGYGETAIQQTAAPAQHSYSKSTRTAGTVYAKVRHPFTAHPTRPDELSAEKDENLIIIAQSNHEWVVAKPIMRLGGPGLIPIDFIYVFDEVPLGSDSSTSPPPVADPLEALRKAGVPSVEEWKRMAAQYKNSSITLGKFDGGRSPGAQQPSLEQGMGRLSMQPDTRQSSGNGSHHGGEYRSAGPSPVSQEAYDSQPPSQLPAPIWARIPRYCFAEQKYWFVIETELENGRCYELSRYYQDFYDFQIALLAEFPVEAGNTGTQKRTLPYMPGPVSYVTDAITEGRLYNLDAYVKNLLNQPPHISRCDLVKLFFAPREGDYDIDPQLNGEEEYRLSEGSHQSSVESQTNTMSRRSSPSNANGYGYAGVAATPRVGNGTLQSWSPAADLFGHGRADSGTGSSQAAMKIKVRFNDEVFAMRVPKDVQYQDLHDKIRDRVKAVPGEQIQLFYHDDMSGVLQILQSDLHLVNALQRQEKLTILVKVH
ncbi:hypothetical protein CDD80_2034 [Ophiocordyceps camponoti-rufipedis]|uniref:Uncharacterized protein n=1 Tax=Ophiocordyceps camponoti-rufipedis TaxID=2004952 RepID=A0A2C5Z1X3_9HYPO|nr:hypothetical protein CDD80_2034 [Ophiocordyceps camponoti-rufipedis]